MTTIKIDGIVATSSTQPRCALDKRIVERYAEALKDGAVFPPIVVFESAGKQYLADGFHRVEACKLAGIGKIKAEIHEGDERQAVLYAVGTNETHGYNRTNEDKRRAVDMLLADPEWSTWTDREIARQCRVSHTFVANRRERAINERAAPAPDQHQAEKSSARIERQRENPNKVDAQKAVELLCSIPFDGFSYREQFGEAVPFDKAEYAARWLDEYTPE